MVKIYHNPRCTKSRQGLAYLKEHHIEFEEIRYLDTGIDAKELSDLVNLLGISPIDLVRRNESIWKSAFKGKDLSDQEVIEAMVAFPKLIERPIIVNNDKAVIGRPAEHIAKLF